MEHHISRMAGDRLAKIVRDDRQAGNRSPGRPRKSHWIKQDYA